MDTLKVDTYASYKDSGVEWIGEVPSHWEVKKFKRVFYEIKKRSNPELNCGSISFGKVIYKDDEKIPESTKRSYQVVLKGDFLVNPLNLNYDLISLRIALSDIDVVVSSGYIVLSNSVALDKTFYKYFLHRFDVAFMKLLGSGVRQTLSYNDIANCDLIFPPLKEQSAIASFLDRKTAQIDKAISIKEKQIELLKERRQILIHQTVTRGLNPNVKLKDSGVEWIGEIPQNWEIKKIKHISSQIVDGAHFTPTYVDKGVPFLRVTDLSTPLQTSIDWENVKYIPYKEHKELIKRAHPKKGDILLSKNGTIGLTKVIDWDEEFSFFVSLCLIKLLSNVDPQYFCLFFNSPIVDKQITFGSSRTSVTNLHLEKIKELLIIVPPIQEQLNIVTKLNLQLIKFDTLHRKELDQIEKLKELKSTLINSAVTGKIKVS